MHLLSRVSSCWSCRLRLPEPLASCPTLACVSWPRDFAPPQTSVAQPELPLFPKPELKERAHQGSVRHLADRGARKTPGARSCLARLISQSGEELGRFHSAATPNARCPLGNPLLVAHEQRAPRHGLRAMLSTIGEAQFRGAYFPRTCVEGHIRKGEGARFLNAASNL